MLLEQFCGSGLLTEDIVRDAYSGAGYEFKVAYNSLSEMADEIHRNPSPEQNG